MQNPSPSCERALTVVTNTVRRGYAKHHAKHLWLAIVLLALACCPQVNRPAIQDIENETVLIRDDKFVCAGVWVSPTLVLTAGHCALAIGCPEDADDDEDLNNEETEPCSPLGAKVPVRTRTADIAQGVVVKYDKPYDLSLIHVADPPRHPVAALSDVSPQVGDSVCAVGHPMGLLWVYVRGAVSGFLAEDEDTHTSDRLQIDAHIHPGNSGGGVFDVRGRLVGIVSFNAGPFGSDLAFAVPESQIRAFLGVVYQ